MKCFVLVLNDMRMSNIENKMIACRADTREDLEKLLEAEYVPGGWTDGQWGKTFKQGGMLEWYNPPNDFFGQGIYPVDTNEMIKKETESILTWWQHEIEPLPKVTP